MNTLFAFLFVISLAGLIIGLISPKLVIRWGQKRGRMQVLLYCGLIMVISLFMFDATETPEQRQADAARNKIAMQTAKPPVKNKVAQPKANNKVKVKVKAKVKEQEDKHIPDLMPSDIYLNMEKQGYKTEKTFDPDNGNLWTSTGHEAGIDYSVEVFCQDSIAVDTVTATAIIEDVVNKDIEATKPFLKYVGSVPYKGSDPEQVASWIDKNFYTNNASTVISGVKFTINFKTKFARMLTIEKE